MAPLIFLAGGDATGDAALFPLLPLGYGETATTATTGVGSCLPFLGLSLVCTGCFFVSTDFDLLTGTGLLGDFAGVGDLVLSLAFAFLAALTSFFFFGGMFINKF